MLSFVTFNPNFETSNGIIFLFIPTAVSLLRLIANETMCDEKLVNILQVEGVCEFFKGKPIFSNNETEASEELSGLFTLLFLSTIYIILVIEKKKKFKQITNILKSIDNKEKVNSQLYDDLVTLVRFTIS